METRDFTPGDSIKTIEYALQQARSEKTGAYYYYIVRGALLFIHYFLFFLITKFPDWKSGLMTTIIWGVFPIGGLLSYLRGKKDAGTEKALSYHEKIYLYAFGGFAIAFGTVFISSFIQHATLFISLFPVLIGFPVFVVGGITRHRASIIGGVLAIIFTGISLNTSMEIQYLIAALSALISCLIPGLLMKNKNV